MALFDSAMMGKFRMWEQQTRAASLAVDPNTASTLADYHQRYPWMSTDAKWSLAKAGVDPTDPAAQQAAAAAAHLEVNQGLGFQRIGSPVTKPSGDPDTTAVFQQLDALQANRGTPPPPSIQVAAGVSPLQQIMGDYWKNVTPELKTKLAGVTFEQDDGRKQQLGLREDQVLYKLGGTFSSLDRDEKRVIEDMVAKYGDNNNIDASVDYISPNGGTVKGSGASDYANQDSVPYVSTSQPVTFDKPALQLGGYDLTDLGAITPIVRNTFMALNAPRQELTGEFRNLYELAQSVHEGHPTNPNWLQSQSDLGVTIGDVLAGRDVQQGSGFFVDPNSAVAQERVRRESQRGVFANGDPITLGRSFASDVLMLQPGSKPAMFVSGLVDASSAVATDPTVWGLKGISLAREGAGLIGAENSATQGLKAWQESGQVTQGLKSFQEAGGLAGLRPTVTPDGVNAWLDSPDRLPTLQKIADTTSARTIYHGFNGAIDPAVAAKLADATDPADVASIIRTQLGTQVRTPFKVSDFNAKNSMFPSIGDNTNPEAVLKTPSRWTAMMPHDSVDGTSLHANVTELERAAALTKAPKEQLESWFDQMARTDQPFQRQAVWQQMMNDTAERLVGKGIAGDRAKALTRMAQSRQAADSAYAVQEIAGGRGAVTGTTVIGDKPTVLVDSQPLMMSQTTNGMIPLPDWRAMRRALSAPPVRAALENPAVAVSENALLKLQQVWKGFQIATVKTMIKVLGDEQFAIGARGYDSLLTHPLDAASIILGTAKAELPEDAGFLARVRDATAGSVRWGAAKVPGVDPALSATVEGHNFDDLEKLQQVASHGIDASVTDLGVLHANNWQTLEHVPGVNDAEYLQAHARHLAQFAASDDVRGMVQAGSLPQAQAWYWDGPGAKLRLDLANDSAYAGSGLDVSRAVSDEHVTKVLNQVQVVTNGNPDLVNMIATGKLGKVPPTPEPAASNLPPLYHGTSSPIAEIGDKYTSGSGANNLFGPGFYTTDREGIASKYVRKGSGTEPTVYSVKWNGSAAPRLLDLEQPFPADARQIVQDHANAMLRSDHLDFNQDTADELSRLIGDPASTGADIYSTIRRAYGEAGLPKYEVDDALSSLSDNLESAGYDGFTHTGGLRVGQGKELHGVRIFFDPQKVTVSALPEAQPGTPIWNTVRDGTPRISRNYVTALEPYQSDFPNLTIQQKALYSKDLAKKQLADHFFGRVIHTLLGTPSAVLSKSPLFRQAYWEHIIDTSPFLTPEAQAEALRVAENEAKLPKDLLDELHQKIALGNRSSEPFTGTLDLKTADDLAQSHALDIVQRTTHEFSDRSQAFDMLRLLTPFGEVWRKTIRRWANIVNENPNVVNRLQQGIQALQSPDLGALMGGPAGQGFFHTDQNGQEVFTVPGSEWATNALTGVPVPLVGDVKGLSLGTEFFPALGPVASIPVAWTMNQLHAPRDVSELIFPYGPPKDWNDLVNYAPSWLQKAVGHDRPTSPDSVRTFNNTVIDYVRYGLTNGDYDLSTPAGIQSAMEDATTKAHELYWIRSAAQYFVPGAPSPQMLIRDKSGILIDAGLLVQDYKKLQDQDPNTAGQKFLDQYGPDVFRAMTSKSYAYTFGIPTSADSSDWVDAHSTVKRDFPHLFGYFAPPSDPNEFDYNIYVDQLQPGQGRAPLSPDQWAKVANARLAALQYGTLRDRIDKLSGGKLNDGLRAILASKKQQLMRDYPGYEESLYGGSGLPARSDPKLLVDEAIHASNDPTVKSTDAGQGLAQYLTVRSKVDKAWVAAGYKSGSWATSSGASAIALRSLLRSSGAQTETAHPQFGPLFEDVFDREMRDDTNPNALTPGG